MSISVGYNLPLLEWLLRTVSPCSAPDCPTVLDVRVPINQLASVSVVGHSPEDVIVPQGVSPNHPTHDLSGLNLRRTLTSPFETSVENVEPSPPVHHNASPNDNSSALVTVSFHVATGMKQCLDLSSNQLVSKIA
ncbi:hypothetical protein TNCV_2701941 [Trichonephila clavipes]|nr:hypothetical protein TNCV_2701941 [Trichonephila clavipes]